MNILIVGNGFDLSHYLPTKYDHFMDVMKAIESKETGEKVVDLSIHTVSEWMRILEQIFEKRKGVEQPNYDMDFNELFSCIRDKWFIEKTKELYLTEQIKISCQDVLKLQYRLELNDWYQYFKNHVEEIKTWIDFEQKIEEVLTTLASCILEIEKIKRSTDLFEYFDYKKKEGDRIKEKDLNILSFFKFIKPEDYVVMATVYDTVKSSRNNLNPNFCHGKNLKNGFNPSGFLTYLYSQLEEFIEIFNIYLDLIVNEFKHQTQLQIDAKEWIYPDLIYSFNYTNTYARFHDSVKIEYLHGSHGEYQNIVLGVSDLEHENLKKLKAYGFTKYHQKLLKNTDYKFLNESDGIKSIIRFWKRISEKNQPITLADKEKNRLNIFIWGHSLDISDEVYIKEIFSLNDESYCNVHVVVYYFDNQAKFHLLANLLHILGKEKVELWMKNDWLKFEPNPNLVEINNIQSVDLPKFG